MKSAHDFPAHVVTYPWLAGEIFQQVSEEMVYLVEYCHAWRLFVYRILLDIITNQIFIHLVLQH
jgi:hypothetical protein